MGHVYGSSSNVKKYGPSEQRGLTLWKQSVSLVTSCENLRNHSTIYIPLNAKLYHQSS